MILGSDLIGDRGRGRRLPVVKRSADAACGPTERGVETAAFTSVFLAFTVAQPSKAGVTPFFKMMFPYFAISPVMTTAKADLARS